MSSFPRYLIRRLIGGLITLIGVSVLAFTTTALVPGNAADILLGSYATPARVEALTRQLGLNGPLYERYAKWLWTIFHGDLGASALSGQSVASILAQALPVTLELTVLTVVVSVLVAVPVSLVMAEWSSRWWSRVLAWLINLGISVPGFVVGILLIIVVAVEVHAFPSGGYVRLGSSMGQNLRSMALPTVTLAIYICPALTRFMRARSVDILRREFIEVARAKGITRARLLARHVAPNTAVMSLTFLGLQLGSLISGAIVTEVVFSLPGMGQAGLNALLNRDYPVVQGVVLVVGSGYVIINLLVDILYGLLDPRIRQG